MYVRESAEEFRLRKLRDILLLESAAIAVIEQLLQKAAGDDLVQLLNDAQIVHKSHKRSLVKLTEAFTQSPAAVQSKVPMSMDAFLKSGRTNPRTPYAMIQAMEQDMLDSMIEFDKRYSGIIDQLLLEQHALSDRVNVAIQLLTRILPSHAV